MESTKCKVCGKIAFMNDLNAETKEYMMDPGKFCIYRGRHIVPRRTAERELLEILKIRKDFIKKLIDGTKHLGSFVDNPASPEWRQAYAIIMAARQENPPCPKCGGRTVKSGKEIRVGGKRQRYQCTECGSTYVPPKEEE